MSACKPINASEPRGGPLVNNALLAKLHTLKHSLLELLVVDLLASIIGIRFAMEGEESSEIELRGLKKLDLANVNLKNSISMRLTICARAVRYVRSATGRCLVCSSQFRARSPPGSAWWSAVQDCSFAPPSA